MPPYQGRQPFPPWQPDISDQVPNVSADVVNVLPRNDGWGPFPSFVPFTQPLPGGRACRGFFYARNPDGSVATFAGSADAKLWQLNVNTLTWTDVSRSGGTYGALATTRNWSFVQFNNFVLAVQGNDNPQVFNLSSPATFTDLGGSPPQADFVAVVNRFLVLSGLTGTGFQYRVQWSDLDNITQWTAGVGQADFQDLPDGGRPLAVAGFDLYAVIFQDSQARLMTYAPGSPVIFTITKITGGDGNGLFAPYGWVIDQDTVFWVSQEGFKQLPPGGSPTAIGRELVDRTFFGSVDTGNIQLCIATTDPVASRIYLAYKSTTGQAGLWDTILIYDWRLQRWARAKQMGQYLTVFSRPGLTLEQMDALTPGSVGITGFGPGASNGAGGNLVRVTVTSTTGMSTAQQQTVFGKWNITLVNTIIGNANAALSNSINNVQNSANSQWGSWVINIINGTQVDLVGSLWNGSSTYTSGGVLGANIELLTFSFDSISTFVIPSLAAFGSNGSLGFYNGPASEAIIETGEQGTQEKRMFVKGFRAISDAPTILGSVSYRDNPQAPYTYTTEVGLDGFTGTILVAGGGIDTRYARGKIRIPAGTVWTYALGLEPDLKLTGTY